MKTFFRTDFGIMLLFPISYVASVMPVVTLAYGGFWSYVVAFFFYATVLLLLYHIKIMVPGIAAALSVLEPRYEIIHKYLSDIYPLTFFIGSPMFFSIAFQCGIAGDTSRDIDPRIHTISWISFAVLAALEITYSVVWIRRVRSSW